MPVLVELQDENEDDPLKGSLLLLSFLDSWTFLKVP